MTPEEFKNLKVGDELLNKEFGNTYAIIVELTPYQYSKLDGIYVEWHDNDGDHGFTPLADFEREIDKWDIVPVGSNT